MKPFYLIFGLILFVIQNIYTQPFIHANHFSKDKIGIVIKQDSISKAEDMLLTNNRLKSDKKIKKCSFDVRRVLLFGVLGIGLNYTIRAAFQGMIFPNYRFAIEGAIVGAVVGYISSSVTNDKCKKQLEAQKNKSESK